MRKFLILLAVLAAATLLEDRPGRAYGDGPWCAVQSLGRGSSVERCVFWDFDTCVQEVIAGNRGFCNQNPRWAGRLAAASVRPKPSRKRRHH